MAALMRRIFSDERFVYQISQKQKIGKCDFLQEISQKGYLQMNMKRILISITKKQKYHFDILGIISVLSMGTTIGKQFLLMIDKRNLYNLWRMVDKKYP
jgi:hypothetical protein